MTSEQSEIVSIGFVPRFTQGGSHVTRQFPKLKYGGASLFGDS